MKRWFLLLMVLCSIFVSSLAYADTCWAQASRHFGIDQNLLKAIAWQESRGRADAVGPPLRGGNVALGMMQVNTIHLPALKKLGVTREHLFDPCTNIKIGASILADCIRREGATWNAVGCYYTGPNLRSPKIRISYVRSVIRHYEGYRQMSASKTSSS